MFVLFQQCVMCSLIVSYARDLFIVFFVKTATIKRRTLLPYGQTYTLTKGLKISILEEMLSHYSDVLRFSNNNFYFPDKTMKHYLLLYAYRNVKQQHDLPKSTKRSKFCLFFFFDENKI